MTENNNDGGGQGGEGGGTGGTGGQQQPTYTPPQSQADLDRIVEQRLARERQKFADYDDLKGKASKYDELEEKNKSELEKERDRAAKAEERAAKAEREALKSRVAAEKNVPASALSGSTEDELKASADALIAWRGGQNPPPSPSQLGSGSGGGAGGAGGGAQTDKERAAAALRGLGSARN